MSITCSCGSCLENIKEFKDHLEIQRSFRKCSCISHNIVTQSELSIEKEKENYLNWAQE